MPKSSRVTVSLNASQKQSERVIVVDSSYEFERYVDVAFVNESTVVVDWESAVAPMSRHVFSLVTGKCLESQRGLMRDFEIHQDSISLFVKEKKA